MGLGDEMRTDGFYIKHKNIEEAFQFFGLTLDGGYNAYESLDDFEYLKEFKYVGVDCDGDIVFYNNASTYGENAEEMTLQQVRDMFKKDDEWVNGIPPVGCECEILLRPSTEYKPFKVNHISQRFVLGSVNGGTEISRKLCKVKFRPIKSQEEIERENYINEMFKDAGVVGSKSAFERLVDKGYRKINPISDEDICSKIRELGSDNDSNKGAVAWGINWAIDTMLGEDKGDL